MKDHNPEMSHWFELPLPWYDITLRLAIALVCGGVVGLERELRGHSAGLRTHMLVALGAAAFSVVGVAMFEIVRQHAVAHEYDPPGDPLRTISGVVTGVGFLGAGAIIHQGGKAAGLTTAAGLWAVAAVGVASGAGLPLVAVIVTLLIFITLAVVRFVEPPIGKTDESRRHI